MDPNRDWPAFLAAVIAAARLGGACEHKMSLGVSPSVRWSTDLVRRTRFTDRLLHGEFSTAPFVIVGAVAVIERVGPARRVQFDTGEHDFVGGERVSYVGEKFKLTEAQAAEVKAACAPYSFRYGVDYGMKLRKYQPVHDEILVDPGYVSIAGYQRIARAMRAQYPVLHANFPQLDTPMQGGMLT